MDFTSNGNKFPRAVVFGPAKYGRMDWDNILVLSLFEKLKLFIGLIRLQDKLGKMIQIQVDWLQLFAGVSTPLLRMNKYVSYLPRGWIVNIHNLLLDTGVQVELSETWIPTPQRNND